MFNNWQGLGAFAAVAAAAQAQAQTVYGQVQGLAATGQPMIGMGLDALGNPQQQQQMYNWYYSHWPQNMMAPQQAFPGIMQQQYPPLPEGGQNAPPAPPPAEPPADVRPPLPPEPPPDEKSGNSQARMAPGLPGGPQAQLHAGKEPTWQQQKMPALQQQWQPPPPPAEDPPQPPSSTQSGKGDKKPVDPALSLAFDNVIKEQQEFVTQYEQWKHQYTNWQEQNKNHPNKEQFDQYLSQWKHYEQQMEERRRDIMRRKQEIEEKMNVSATPAVALSLGDTQKMGLGPHQSAQGARGPQDSSAKFGGSTTPGVSAPIDQSKDSRFLGRGVPSINKRPGIHTSQEHGDNQREPSYGNPDRLHNPHDANSKPSLLGEKPPGLLGDKPPGLLGDKPPGLLGDKPPSLLGDKPPSLLGDKPPSLLGDKPPSLLGDKPPNLLGDKPPSLLGDKPQSLLGDKPQSLLGDKPLTVAGTSMGSNYSDGGQGGFGPRGAGGMQRHDQGHFQGPPKGPGPTGLLGDAPPQFQGQPNMDMSVQAGQGKGKSYPGSGIGGNQVEGGEDDMDLEESQDQEDFRQSFQNRSSHHFHGGPGPQRFPGPQSQRFQGPPHQQGPSMPGPQNFRGQGSQDFSGQRGRGHTSVGPHSMQGPGQRFPGPVQRFQRPAHGVGGHEDQEGFEEQESDNTLFQDFNSSDAHWGSGRGRGGLANFGHRGRGFGQGNANTFRGRGAGQLPGSRDSFNEQRGVGMDFRDNNQFGEEKDEGMGQESALREGGMGQISHDDFRGRSVRGRGRGAPDNFVARGMNQEEHVWNEGGREMVYRGRGMPPRGRGGPPGMIGAGRVYDEQSLGGDNFEPYKDDQNVEGGEINQYGNEQSQDFQDGQQNFEGSQFQRHGFSGPSFRGLGRGGPRMQGPQGLLTQQGPQGHVSQQGQVGQQGQYVGRGGPHGQFPGVSGPRGPLLGRGGQQGQLAGRGRGRGVGKSDRESGSQNQGFQGLDQEQSDDWGNERQDDWSNEYASKGEGGKIDGDDPNLAFGIRTGGDGPGSHFPPPVSGTGNMFHGQPGPSERFGGPQGSQANRFSGPHGSRFPGQAMSGPPRFEGPRFPGPVNERPQFPGPLRGMGPQGQNQMRGPKPLMSMVFNEHEMKQRLSRGEESVDGARSSDMDRLGDKETLHGPGSGGDQGEVDQPYSGSQHPENRETFAGLGFRQQGQYTSVGPGQGLGQLRQGQGALQGAPEGRELFPGVREQGTEFREPLPGTGEPILSARGRDPMLAQRGLPPVQGELIAQREPIMGGREMLLGVRDPGANAEGRDRLSRPNEWHEGGEYGGASERGQVSHDYGHGVGKGRSLDERWPGQETEDNLAGPGRLFPRATAGQEELDRLPRPPFHSSDDWPLRDAPPRDPLYEEHIRLARLERQLPLDRFGRPIREPYLDRLGYDPFLTRDASLGDRRFRDPFADSFPDPWTRDREHLGDSERVFRPAESIDYGHGQSSNSRLAEDAVKAAPQVIDYGHGNKKEDNSRPSDANLQEGFPKSERSDWSEKRHSQEQNQEQPRSTDREHLERSDVKFSRWDGPSDEYSQRSYDYRGEHDRLELPEDRNRSEPRVRESDRGRPDYRNCYNRGEFDGSDRNRWPDRTGSPERMLDKRERDWPDRSVRGDRFDPQERSDRHLEREWPGRFDRLERPDHSDTDWVRRRDEFDRSDRSDWPSRDRTEHPERLERPERHLEVDRPDRRDILDRFDKPEPPNWIDRPPNPDTLERDSFWHDRPLRRDPLDWGDRLGPDRGLERPDIRHRELDRIRDPGSGGAHDRSPGRFTPPAAAHPESEFVKVEDLICMPGRKSRPSNIVIIVRGLPGSGKTYVSKLLREKEMNSGGSAARMLCLDDYFMVEQEKKEVDPETGKKVTRKVLEYEYEQDMEDAYRQSLFKSFKKTVDDGFFPFIIVDATNEKVTHFEEFWSYAKSKGFQVFVAEMEADVPTCINRNIHKWTEYDIEKVKQRWEKTPPHILRLDIRWLLQEDSITEVEMEDAPDPKKEEGEGASGEKRKKEDDDEEEEDDAGVYKKSKWELDTSEVKLDKLDGLSHGMHKREAAGTTMEDYLQLADDYFARKTKPGKKMVRWADLEERKEQSRRRELGFVVGQTQRDWDRITDDSFADKALNQTKYI